MALSDKLSNIIGVKIPDDIFKQLRTRSEKNSMENRDTNNLVYLQSKTAWVRLVSSVNVTEEKDMRYFSSLGIPMTDPTSLAKNFVLCGGTSRYVENEKNKQVFWAYQQRNGILDPYGSYSPLGERETRDYGFRPMPGITGVTIENQGRLGSIRAATINFKCWDKYQLDIIDTLYLKLGFTMFLEWGQTVYYNNDDQLFTSENYYSMDPFFPGLYKELIQQYISQNSKNSKGNYDAMLGMVTNFNFSLNQDLGFDCTLNLISLGSLADSIKINSLGSSAQAASIINTAVQGERTRVEDAAYEIGTSLLQEKKIFDILRFTYDNIKPLILQQPKETYAYHYPASGDPNIEFYIQNSQDKKRYLLLNQKKVLNFSPEENNTANIKVEDLKKILSEAAINFNNKSIPFVDISSFIVAEKFDLRDGSGDARNIKIPNISYNLGGRNYFISIDLNFNFKVDDSITGDSQTVKLSDGNTIDGVTEIDVKYAWEQINFYGKEPISLGIAKTREESIQIAVNAFYEALKKKNKFIIRNVREGTVGGVNYQFEIDVNIELPNVLADLDTKNGEVKEAKIPRNYKAKSNIYILENSDLLENIETDQQQPIGLEKVQEVKEETTIPNEGATDQNPAQEVNQDQSSDNPFQNLSTLEAALWSVRLHTITEYQKTKSVATDKNKKQFHVQDIVEDGFYKTIFSGGVFSPFLMDLVDDKIDDGDYNDLVKKGQNKQGNFKILSKYGFATNLLTGYTTLYDNVNGVRNYNFAKVDFRDLLKTYLITYPFKNKNSIPNIENNEPVFIKLGALLMLINNNCSMYDSEQGKVTSATPLVYIDFNPNHNFCLSCPQHLSTNPNKVLIPYEGGLSDYKKLFDPNIIQKNFIGYQSGSEFKIATGSFTYLFNPGSKDQPGNGNIVSDNIPAFKKHLSFDGIGNSYRGNIMNILLNIDYLISLIREIAQSNDENKVFLNEFMNRLLLDITKSLGNFNSFRLSYNDAANCIQIVDDQVISSGGKESTLSTTAPSDEYELPLFGKKSIAKTLEIRTEITSRLNHMIAISANSNSKHYSGGDDASSYGFINRGLNDRYVPQRGDIDLDGETPTEELANAATNFNTAVRKIYTGLASEMDDSLVEAATSYYVEWLNREKNNDENIKASAMIPVSVNFTTDGISGITNGHTFTVPKDILPYIYTSERNIDNVNLLNKVGFVITGLTNTIENNTWTTAVKADMIFLKNKIVESKKESVESKKTQTNLDDVNEKGEYLTYINGQKGTYEKVTILDNGQRVLNKYLPFIKKMEEDMKKELGVKLVINSGFRTYDDQKQFRKKHLKKENLHRKEDEHYILNEPAKSFDPVTARPGYSDHQNGTGYDIDVSSSLVFGWLKKNAIKYGFVRTEPTERWHWEYRPGVKNMYAIVKQNDPSWT